MVNFSFDKREIVYLIVLLLAAFAVRFLLFPLPGYYIDTADFRIWFNSAAQHGITQFYNSGWTDYPPFNVYIFWLFGSLGNVLSITGDAITYMVKLAANLFDLGIAVLIYFFVRKQSSFKLALVAAALYAFNPAVIFNSAVWGQLDAIYTFFLVLSLIFALKAKPEFSAITLAVALLTKPQAIALVPLIAYLVYRKSGLRRTFISTIAFAATVFLIVIPFNWQGNPFTGLSNIYFGAYGTYQYTSINAFNLWGLFGLWQPDGGLNILGWVLFGGFTAFTLYVLHKRFNVSGELLAVFCAFMLFFAFFMLPTRIHERYLFPAVSMLALMFPLIRKTRPLYFVLTATLLVNMAYVLSFLNSANPFIPSGDLVVLAVSVINLVMFLYGSVLIWDEFRGCQLAKNTHAVPNQTQEEQVS